MDLSTPLERGKRAKRCRNMANLSRIEMCDDGQININTLKGWELGKHGGLTQDGARRVVARIARAGVNCTTSWLMDAAGEAPNLVYNLPLQNEVIEGNTEESRIKSELIYFSGAFTGRQVSSMKIQDEAMLPLYAADDYVAGVKYYEKNIDFCLGMIGIAELPNGKTLLRKLRKSPNIPDRYDITALNDRCWTSDSIILNVPLASFAPLLWHRRPRTTAALNVQD